MHTANLVLISRLIVDNNTRQAGQLIQNSVFFFSRIFVANSRVQLHDPCKFAEEFRELKHTQFHAQINQLIQQSKPNHSRIEAASRLSKLWRAHAPVNSVAAITAENGHTLVHEEDKAHELGSVWARTFSISPRRPPNSSRNRLSSGPFPTFLLPPAPTLPPS